MRLDIRTPIGLMFSVLGLILVGFGFFGSDDIYGKSLGINVNLWWGIVLLAFGAVMLFFGLGNGKARTEEDRVEH